MEQAQIMRDREEKLIVTAWYEMGIQISKKFADQRITTGTSLLSQQRLALAQRMGTTLQTPSCNDNFYPVSLINMFIKCFISTCIL